MQTRHLILHVLTVCGLISGTAVARPENSQRAAVDFRQNVAPILVEKCVECHNANLQMADLRLDSLSALIESGVIESGNAEQSLLIKRLHDSQLGILMPPTGALSKPEIETLKSWINSGAEWPAGLTLDVIESGQAVDARTRALFTVIRNDDLDAVREMLRDPTLIDARNERHATPLMYAALHASAECVEFLLRLGANVNATDNEGMTALMFAITNIKKVELLLEKGAGVDTQSKLGRNAFLLASAFAGNSAVIDALLQAGADVHYADKQGWTGVVLAARTGDSEQVRKLLDAGGDVNGGDAQRLSPGTPLMQAAWASDIETAKLLLERGANSNPRSLNIALIFAATHGNSPLVKLLLDAGADPLAKVVTNYVPESPIMAASYSDCLDVENVSILLGLGADVRAKDKRGETALTMAGQRGKTAVFEMLQRAAGVDEESRTDDDGAPVQSVVSKSTAGQAPLPTADGLNDDFDVTRIRNLSQKSIALLQSCGPQFFAKSGCVACHQQSATSLAVCLASERGLEVDAQLERQQLKLTSVDLRRKRTAWLQRMKVGGTTHRMGYLLWGLAQANYTPDDITDAAYVELAGLQLSNGSWVSDAHRPPSEYSPVTATAVSLRALQAFAPPGHKVKNQERVQRAMRWLATAPASANAEKAFRLLGLHWGKASGEEIEAASSELLAEQHTNGGWSQLPHLESDAYATGLTLYALNQGGGLPVTHVQYRSGIKFLLDTSHANGAWHVKSRSFAIQPFFESGFPYEHDQWISAAATGWAAMALMQTLEPVH